MMSRVLKLRKEEQWLLEHGFFCVLKLPIKAKEACNSNGQTREPGREVFAVKTNKKMTMYASKWEIQSSPTRRHRKIDYILKSTNASASRQTFQLEKLRLILYPCRR